MIQEVTPAAKKIGLMSTTGTRSSKVYHNLLEPLGYEVVEVPVEREVAVEVIREVPVPVETRVEVAKPVPCVRIVEMDKDVLRTGVRARVLFEFMYRPELVQPSTKVLFTEGKTKAIGTIRELLTSGDSKLPSM